MTANRMLGALLVVLAGCGSTRKEASEMPLEELLDRYVDFLCGQLDDCAGGLAPFLPPEEECLDAYRNALQDQTLPRFLEAMENGTLEYHGDAAQDCLDALEEAGCDIFDNRGPEECEDALDGLVELGGECGMNDECDGQAFCLVETSCPGTCTALLGATESCTGDNDCDVGLTCASGTCQGRAAEGGACEGTSGPDCEFGLLCAGADAGSSGTCTDGADMFTESEGSPCDPQAGTLCLSGLACVVVSVGPLVFECRTEVGSGEDCSIGFPDQCPDGQWCSGTDQATGDVDGTCAPIPQEGATCADAPLVPQCEAGFTCDLASNDCVRISNVDGPCTDDSHCYSNTCESDICVAPDLCVVPEP